MSALDTVMPPRGPCGMCGHPDARHRECDAITSRLRAGDDVWSVIEDHVPQRSTDRCGAIRRWGDEGIDALERLAIAAAHGAGPDPTWVLAELEDIHTSDQWGDQWSRELLRARLGRLVDQLRGHE